MSETKTLTRTEVDTLLGVWEERMVAMGCPRHAGGIAVFRELCESMCRKDEHLVIEMLRHELTKVPPATGRFQFLYIKPEDMPEPPRILYTCPHCGEAFEVNQ